MKNIKFIYSIVFLLFVVISCTVKDGIDKDTTFLNTAASGDLAKIFDISTDNSGNVKITPVGNGVSAFEVSFGHGAGSNTSAVVKPGASATHAYPEGSYTVAIKASDIAGKETTTTYPLKVTYRAPENIAVSINQTAHNVKVKSSADYAHGFTVYFGDAVNETGTSLATGAEISHDYVNAGNYDIKVVALSGGAASADKTVSITVTDPFGFPITFDNAFVSYFFGTFGGGQAFATVENPNISGLNGSNLVGKFTRGWEWWSGTYSPLNTPIDFSQGKIIKVLVYNPDPALIGAKLNVELEWAVGGTPSNGVAVLKVPVTTSGAWEELVFDYSGISAIPADTKFTQLVLRFNDSADGAAGIGQVIYVDNFRLTN